MVSVACSGSVVQEITSLVCANRINLHLRLSILFRDLTEENIQTREQLKFEIMYIVIIMYYSLNNF